MTKDVKTQEARPIRRAVIAETGKAALLTFNTKDLFRAAAA